MNSFVIAEVNDKDANLIIQLIKKVQGKARILKGKALEDFQFAQLINDGMRSGNVPLSKLKEKLQK